MTTSIVVENDHLSPLPSRLHLPDFNKHMGQFFELILVILSFFNTNQNPTISNGPRSGSTTTVEAYLPDTDYVVLLWMQFGCNCDNEEGETDCASRSAVLRSSKTGPEGLPEQGSFGRWFGLDFSILMAIYHLNTRFAKILSFLDHFAT